MKGKTKFIVVTNQKGGVGKTTTAVATASILNARGHKTLLIDVDPQCNSTDTYRAKIDGVATLYDLLLDDEPCTIEETIQHTEAGDIIAGDPALTEADDVLYGKKDRYSTLSNILAELRTNDIYEYVVFDTNPSLNTLLRCALVCCDCAVVPCKASRYGVQGLSSLSATLTEIKEQYRPDLKIAGILPVDFDGRANVYQGIRGALEKVAEAMGTKTFSTAIRRGAKVEEAQDQRMPLIMYAPKSNPEKDYEAYVDELVGGLD